MRAGLTHTHLYIVWALTFSVFSLLNTQNVKALIFFFCFATSDSRLISSFESDIFNASIHKKQPERFDQESEGIVPRCSQANESIY